MPRVGKFNPRGSHVFQEREMPWTFDRRGPWARLLKCVARRAAVAPNPANQDFHQPQPYFLCPSVNSFLVFSRGIATSTSHPIPYCVPCWIKLTFQRPA